MLNPDDKSYEDLQNKELQAWESLCGRCGACCGLFEGDPCEHLVKSETGSYQCAIYENRFGLRKSVGGREFMCVPIRNILHQSWVGDQCCGYKKNCKNNRFPRISG